MIHARFGGLLEPKVAPAAEAAPAPEADEGTCNGEQSSPIYQVSVLSHECIAGL